MKGDIAIFERCRPRLLNIAYRMLGEMSAAEDVVQEAWLRWSAIEASDIRDPLAWLSTATVRLALDALRAARARRESYVGPWLPEPILPDDARIFAADAPAEHAELASDLSLALMHVLERLSPEERAALILHDAFDFDYDEIAATLGKSEPACRKLVSRARERVKTERPRFSAKSEAHRDLLARFAKASAAADARELAALFAPDAIAYTDGGGRVRAALNPIYGADNVVRLIIGLASKSNFLDTLQWKSTEINGRPAMVSIAHGDPLTAITLETDGEKITAIYVQRNPDKLGRVSRALGWPAG
ncbi:MAG TPA: RNA polymerase sigma factor SigJ [Roseiarcus sp.]|nr:RNA polymerase sigma factor SigJ [Roseiarcus sp.]